jgi:hypothetical protein
LEALWGHTKFAKFCVLDHEKPIKQCPDIDDNFKHFSVFILKPILKIMGSMDFLLSMSTTSTNTNEEK